MPKDAQQRWTVDLAAAKVGRSSGKSCKSLLLLICQRPAKPRTAVRFRFRPPLLKKEKRLNGAFSLSGWRSAMGRGCVKTRSGIFHCVVLDQSRRSRCGSDQLGIRKSVRIRAGGTSSMMNLRFHTASTRSGNFPTPSWRYTSIPSEQLDRRRGAAFTRPFARTTAILPFLVQCGAPNSTEIADHCPASCGTIAINQGESTGGLCVASV
jgi:hypothetical protein